ncbi:MAG: hypothetical protein ACRC6B_08830 [Fusobacteriaceae bacterium]
MNETNKKSSKYFYFLKDYCVYFNKELNIDSLYEYINYSITEVINPILFNLISQITETDSMYEKHDLVTDSFLALHETKDIPNISINNIKKSLKNISRLSEAKKRKMNKGDQSAYFEAQDLSVDYDTKLILNTMLDTLNKEERELIEYHFIHGYSREDMVTLKLYKKSKATIDRDINRIFQKLKDTM